MTGPPKVVRVRDNLAVCDALLESSNVKKTKIHMTRQIFLRVDAPFLGAAEAFFENGGHSWSMDGEGVYLVAKLEEAQEVAQWVATSLLWQLPFRCNLVGDGASDDVMAWWGEVTKHAGSLHNLCVNKDGTMGSMGEMISKNWSWMSFGLHPRSVVTPTVENGWQDVSAVAEFGRFMRTAMFAENKRGVKTLTDSVRIKNFQPIKNGPKTLFGEEWSPNGTQMHEATVRWYLGHGADGLWRLKDSFGCDMLQWMIAHAGELRPSTWVWLMEKVFAANDGVTSNEIGNNWLHSAAFNSESQAEMDTVFQFGLTHGVDAMARNKRGKTAIEMMEGNTKNLGFAFANLADSRWPLDLHELQSKWEAAFMKRDASSDLDGAFKSTSPHPKATLKVL